MEQVKISQHQGTEFQGLKVSIVIVNYNGSQWLKRLIESIDNQSFKPYEVILVDDQSIDNSISLVGEAYPWVEICQLEEKGFATVARNTGLQKACGDLVLFLDNDVYLEKNCLDHLVEFSKNYDVVVPKVLFENGVLFAPHEKGPQILDSISAAFIVSKKSMEKLDEFFDKTYLYHYEETDLFCRCYLFGLKLGYQPKATVYHVIKERPDSEKLFYLTVRNYLYGYMKFMGIRNQFFKNIIFTMSSLFFVGVVLNRSWFDQQSKKKPLKIMDKILGMIRRKRISSSRIKNTILFLKALRWNIINIENTFNKNRRLRGRKATLNESTTNGKNRCFF
jgi:GT2 family glycosyltransferase